MLIFKNGKNRFNIQGDWEHFHKIVSDMEMFSGQLAPSNHWNQNLSLNSEYLERYSKDLFRQKYDLLEKMLDPWVGSEGMRPLREDVLKKYEPFLRSIDFQNLLPGNILKHAECNNWIETDLGSIIDFNLLLIFQNNGLKSNRLNILEVGGGYGRLAEVFLDKAPKNIHYVMVDAVPGSLMYSYLYIKNQFPSLKIGSYYMGDEYSENYDCYIMPAWQTSTLSDNFFDSLINIESMQEMLQHQVDFYINLFDRVGKDHSLVYLSNARDYIFLGVWNIPARWRTLYMRNTPRSWTADHPTHILRKYPQGDFNSEHSLHEAAFKMDIRDWNRSILITELNAHIADRDRIICEIQSSLVKSRSNLTVATSPCNYVSIHRIQAVLSQIKLIIEKIIK